MAGNEREKKSETSNNSTWNPDGYVLDQHGNEIFPIEHLLETLGELNKRIRALVFDARHSSHGDMESRLNNMLMLVEDLSIRFKDNEWENLD